jgi:hypothetical protein
VWAKLIRTEEVVEPLPIEAEVVSILINELSLAIWNCTIVLQSDIHNGFTNIMFLHSSTPNFANVSTKRAKIFQQQISSDVGCDGIIIISFEK